VLPVRGALKIAQLAEAQLLTRLGLPLFILFDETTAAEVHAKVRPSARRVAARAVWDLLRNWPPELRLPQVVSFDLPDIFRALPEPCLRQSVEAFGGTFPGWRAFDKALGAQAAKGFKPLLLEYCGLAGSNDTRLLAATLERCRRHPDPVLAAAVNDVLRLASLG